VVGAVGAAAIVVGGTSLVVGDVNNPDSTPSPAESSTAAGPIPAEFDLADGMQRALGTPSRVGRVAPPLSICGESVSLTDGVTASQGVRHADQGDFTARGLSVYPDVGTARAVATDLVARLESCTRPTDGGARAGTPSIRRTAHGDQGWVVTRLADEPGSTFPEAIQIVRLGESLLVIHQREIHGVSLDELAEWTSHQVELLMHRQMCLLTDQGCAWRSDPDVLRPDGWGPVRLGMSREDLQAAGFEEVSSAGECTTVDLGSGEGLLSAADELVSIRVPEGVTTPDGVGLGSSMKEVKELYYWDEQVGDLRLVRASPTAAYEITFEGGRVTRLTLSTVGDECSD
jgi:hypothetical protein